MATRLWMTNAAFCSILVVIGVCCGSAAGADRITGTIRFSVMNRELKQMVELTSDDGDFERNGCHPTEPFAIVIHGWRDYSSSEWIVDLLANLTTYREGCVMYMGYANNSRTIDYFGELVPYFDPLATALTDYLRRLESLGFDPDKGLMFGFSFGANLALEAGRRFGLQKFGRIDACDSAGPGFDSKREYVQLDPKLAAKHVQCIHTSATLGTRFRDCHISWNMGRCGREQPAAGLYPKGSHGLCPYIYNSAFEHNFYAVPKPKECKALRPAAEWPSKLRMGYFCDMESGVSGELFSPTTKLYPYTDESSNNEL